MMADDKKMDDWHRKALCNFDNAYNDTLSV